MKGDGRALTRHCFYGGYNCPHGISHIQLTSQDPFIVCIVITLLSANSPSSFLHRHRSFVTTSQQHGTRQAWTSTRKATPSEGGGEQMVTPADLLLQQQEAFNSPEALPCSPYKPVKRCKASSAHLDVIDEGVVADTKGDAADG